MDTRQGFRRILVAAAGTIAVLGAAHGQQAPYVFKDTVPVKPKGMADMRGAALGNPTLIGGSGKNDMTKWLISISEANEIDRERLELLEKKLELLEKRLLELEGKRK